MRAGDHLLPIGSETVVGEVQANVNEGRSGNAGLVFQAQFAF
jgi:hypothetical protein